jgi:hypothetical protein
MITCAFESFTTASYTVEDNHILHYFCIQFSIWVFGCAILSFSIKCTIRFYLNILAFNPLGCRIVYVRVSSAYTILHVYTPCSCYLHSLPAYPCDPMCGVILARFNVSTLFWNWGSLCAGVVCCFLVVCWLVVVFVCLVCVNRHHSSPVPSLHNLHRVELKGGQGSGGFPVGGSLPIFICL